MIVQMIVQKVEQKIVQSIVQKIVQKVVQMIVQKVVSECAEKIEVQSCMHYNMTFTEDVRNSIKNSGIISTLKLYFEKKKMLFLSVCILTETVSPKYRTRYCKKYIDCNKDYGPINIAKEIEALGNKELIMSQQEIFVETILLSLKIIDNVMQTEVSDAVLKFLYKNLKAAEIGDLFYGLAKKITMRRKEFIKFAFVVSDMTLLRVLKYDHNDIFHGSSDDNFIQAFIEHYGYRSMVLNIRNFPGRIYDHFKTIKNMSAFDIQIICHHIVSRNWTTDIGFILFAMIMYPIVPISINPVSLSILNDSEGRLNVFKYILGARKLMDPEKKNNEDFVGRVTRALMRLFGLQSIPTVINSDFDYTAILSRVVRGTDSVMDLCNYIANNSMEDCINELGINFIEKSFNEVVTYKQEKIDAEIGHTNFLKIAAAYDVQRSLMNMPVDILSRIPQHVSFEYHDTQFEYLLKYGNQVNTNLSAMSTWSKARGRLFINFCVHSNVHIKSELFWSIINNDYLRGASREVWQDSSLIKLHEIEHDYPQLGHYLIKLGYPASFILMIYLNNLSVSKLCNQGIIDEIIYLFSLEDKIMIIPDSHAKLFRDAIYHFAFSSTNDRTQFLNGFNECWIKYALADKSC